MSKEVKEPAVRMIKRDTISTAKAWGIRLAAVALSLIVAGVLCVAVLVPVVGRKKVQIQWFQFPKQTRIFLRLHDW